MIKVKGVISTMKKHILTSVAAILMVGATAFSVLTFTGCSCTGKGKKSQQTATTAAQQQAKTFEGSDLTVCESWIGKVNTQVGMEAYTANGRIEIKGKLFDKDATGYATVENGGNVISTVNLTCDTLDYDTAKSELTKKYGDPKSDEGTECTFRTGSNTAILTQNGSGIKLVIR